MTTAYTSLLGLALPVTGELSGTWGDTVNTAITSLLDTAIAGTTSITTDADITLSTTTGASNQARQAIILWNPASGTTTRNITAPAQSKMYVVINASGGTQSIVIRGAGPTTGVTIAKGESATVAWNGSDFVKVSSNAVFGALTVSNLTDTALTSGRVTYATTGGLLTDSANLTFNGTTLTLTGLSNTGNTTLGDAAADTVTVNGTITSNLIFTDNTYDIGASGATRPRNLFVAGNATIGGLTTGRVVYTSTSGLLASSSNLTYAGTDLANSNGDIIIGNNPAVTTRMFRAIEVGAAGNNAGIAFSTNGGKGAIYGQSGSANLSIVSGNSGAIAFGYSTGNADASANFISLGAWTTTGLGVGIDSPVSRIDVRSPSSIIANYQQIQAFSTDTSAAIDLGGGIGLGGFHNSTQIATFGTIVGRKENGTSSNYAGYLAFGTNAQATGVVERMRIDSGGKLLLGLTSGSGLSNYDFAMINTGSIRFRNAANSAYISAFYFDSSNGLQIGTGGSLYNITFGISGIGEVARFNNGTGYLGIGTTSPGALLDVGPTASPSIPAAILRGGAGIGNTGGLGLYTNDSSATARNWGLVSNSSAYGDFAIRQGNALFASPFSAGVDRLYISLAGNVGIGTASPAGKLDVAGTIGISPGNNPALIRRTSVNGSYGVYLQGNTQDTRSDTYPGASIGVAGGPIVGDAYAGRIDLVAYGNLTDATSNIITFQRRTGVNTTAQSGAFDSSGNLLVAATSTYNSAKLAVAGDLEARGNMRSYFSSRGGLAIGASVNLFTVNNGSYGTAVSMIVYVQQRDDNVGSLSNYQFSITGWSGSSANVTTSSTQAYGSGAPLSVSVTAASGGLIVTLTNASGRASTTMNMSAIVLTGYESINWGW